MKNNKKRLILIATIIALFSELLISCYTPNPLYGTWGDNIGNTITIRADGTFSSTIRNSMGVKVDYTGSWQCFDNVLVITKDTGTRFNSEWDVRGSILYLTWVDDKDVSQSMNLYHISKQ